MVQNSLQTIQSHEKAMFGADEATIEQRATKIFPGFRDAQRERRSCPTGERVGFRSEVC